ncbi:hypothetical protein A3D00_03835 [Candidatus Woesebacteria bacterium RIFCSPHIGHO2_02_FULL_38_9]|nr:MAG: hypothetical protein A3D00_03835 [Candidatus Woesebacteria bacterium RIFCSPHIGHO2_02_FULL_38_9]OGM56817.1 MAG: hypothetical protein A3A50_03805 [Candidatus Woesebacteria bacterium RIFCSPLOWO2_01_FULL_38_20]
MSKQDEGKYPQDKNEKTPSELGEESSAGGSMSVPGSDDVDKMYEEVFGDDPSGKTLGEELEQDEEGLTDKEEDQLKKQRSGRVINKF